MKSQGTAIRRRVHWNLAHSPYGRFSIGEKDGQKEHFHLRGCADVGAGVGASARTGARRGATMPLFTGVFGVILIL